MRSILTQLIVLVALISFGTTQTTPGPPIPSTRGYDIVLGIDRTTPTPANVDEYISNLFKIVENFSKLMFEATSKYFYIRHAELVIPISWNPTTHSTFPTQHSPESSQMRISHLITTPRSENPNMCGKIGNYIEMPLSFFESVTNGTFGSPEKALLHLWAKYRWGVWEEHGYSHSLNFPYFYNTGGDWKAVGCSDEELEGEFINIETNEICKNTDEYSPGPECRFYPNDTNIATTSLMYLTSLPKVTKFCTEDNHNKEAPNKQNIFCSHKSTWEVIESSPDFNTGNIEDGLIDEWPGMETIIITKTTTRPMLYLLLDNGISAIPQDHFSRIREALIALFQGGGVPSGSIASIGLFGMDSKQILEEAVPWTVSNGTNEMFRSILDNLRPDGLLFRNFGLAILDTINKIKEVQHSAGTVLVVFKSGAGGNFESIHYEEDIIAAAKESNIQLYALEIKQSLSRPNINLENLVSTISNDGIHFNINDSQVIDNIEDQFLRNISVTLRQSTLQKSGNYRLVYKKFLKQEDEERR